MLIQKVAVAALILLLTRPSWAGRPDDYELEVDWLLNSSPFVASVDDDILEIRVGTGLNLPRADITPAKVRHCGCRCRS